MGFLADVEAASFDLPVRVLGELFNVLTRQLPRDASSAAEVVRGWRGVFAVVPTTDAVLARGINVVGAQGSAVWDAIILAAAAEGGRRVLLSEDMQHGFTRGCRHRESACCLAISGAR
jgi:predicted nucleic acid-binding protein